DPGRWTHYPVGTVPAEWWDAVREHLPAFDRDLSPSMRMGAIAERLRTWPGARSSAHPQTAFAAVGRLAGTLMSGDELGVTLGRDFEARTAHVRTGMIGSAFSRLFGVAEAVEFAAQWLPLHRQAGRDQ